MKNRVAVRIEANYEIGMGHMVRCLAITNSLSKYKYDVFYFISSGSKLIKGILEDNTVKVVILPVYENENEDADWILNYCSENKIYFNFFISDNYNLSLNWEKKIARISDSVVAIDDLANRQHAVNYLIDTGLGRMSQDYLNLCVEPVTMLLGEQYSILRYEFYLLKKRSFEKRLKTKFIESLLISFGATDPSNDTLKTLKLIESIGFKGTVNVLTTKLNENLPELEAQALNNNRIVMHIDSQSVSEVIHDSDLAIGSLGGSAIERISLGLPSICILTENNQKFNARQLSEKKVIKLIELNLIERTLKACLKASFMDEWSEISRNCFSLYDGFGIHRILNQVFSNTQKIELVEMTKEHCLDLFNLQIERGSRKYSRSEIPPTWDEHVEWFYQALKNEQRRMWIIKCYGQNCGYIRLDDIGSEMEEVSILISARFRRLGLALSAIKSVVKKSKYSKIIATVHKNNLASKNLFMETGFIRDSINSYVWNKK